MPYSNIHWIKLKLEILNDKRFIFDLNNDQKWLYIGLLLLAGATGNRIPNDENYLKNRLNLPENSQKIRENLDFILNTFSKLISNSAHLKFKNFNKLHNRLGDSEGTPKELQRGTQIREDKIRIDKIIEEYIRLRNWESSIKDNPSLLTNIYKRNCKATKCLLEISGDIDKAIQAMRTMAINYKEKNLTWTLETVIKHYPDLIKPQKPKTRVVL